MNKYLGKKFEDILTPEDWKNMANGALQKLFYAISVLELIAASKRPDGTYNRSREACEKLAKETLEKLNK